MVSKNMVSIGVGIRRSFAEARSIERESRNWSTSLSLSSSTDKLDYIEESRTVFLTQIQKSRSNQISIKCTRISIEENRLLFRCSWNGSSWTMESFETCKIEEKDRMRWEKRGSINNSVINFPLWASEWKFAFVGRRADFIFRGCFDCHHLSPRLPPLFIFRDPSDCPTRRETSYLPFRSRKLFLPIAAFRPVFFFFFSSPSNPAWPKKFLPTALPIRKILNKRI